MNKEPRYKIKNTSHKLQTYREVYLFSQLYNKKLNIGDVVETHDLIDFLKNQHIHDHAIISIMEIIIDNGMDEDLKRDLPEVVILNKRISQAIMALRGLYGSEQWEQEELHYKNIVTRKERLGNIIPEL
jgi:hypothetical protein